MACGDTSPAGFAGHWREWHRGHGCELDPNRCGVMAEENPAVDAIEVGGTYMDRSIADFQRACFVTISAEQRNVSPDTALIALLCDAVRCSRELSMAAARAMDEDSASLKAQLAAAQERERILTDGLCDLRDMLESDCDPSAIVTGIVGALANAKAVKP